MNDWFDATQREEATKVFCTYLDQLANKAVRDACSVNKTNYNNPQLLATASKLARDTFATQGGFVKEEDYPAGAAPKGAIPKDVNFTVYEEEDKLPRDYAVVIVLPKQGHLPTGSSWDVFGIYRCTWSPWAALPIGSPEG
jgi:hypothetical protein